ncbi:phage antirepressor KilAC domain-containing protein [Corynebacterium amycolatum]|jgi:prophage antirepressor-like protein|uniref:Phage antirepressor KilAC domain-containing protein n=1 Tax=Corynebacterium amycolatum TaxID=43765 RepID=A0AAW9SW26_CORAY|nr:MULTISPECIES: phage antirepressor KilAC domain-containing protein [Corynebacterium]KAA1271071.1 BRO family protein [Corynebacterium striatum]MDK7238126.1 phage antirepressor KilAC domain-containing protein [Corynebacterium amycolatum]MDK7248090.1 phage antirepressor KilAC domain-containing protein [Corynebacterium amycolatum]MDU7717774.1 phage antirepressor KilAC domain-containing protein [Cutibacterium avidum]
MATRDLQVFTNDAFGTIRTVEHEDKVYFCGRDVATALGYKDPVNAIKQHGRGVAFHHPITDALGRTQEARFITEGDLYRLIFSSKLPAAQDFEAWVVNEVLPTIRRHGVYAIDELLDNDEFLEHAIIQLRSERAKRLAAEQALLEAAPKVSYYDVVLQSDSLLSITEIAKDYGLSAKKLNTLLHEAGVQFKQSGRWFLYARFAEQGYTQSKTHEYDEGKTRTHMYWTQKGRLFVYDLLKNQFDLLPVIEQDGGAA